MTLSAGARLGPYEILAPLGAGGMGEVYRARDTRLGREVAIKVLPAELRADRERLSRFEKEARSASALNHPAIVTIHDIGESGGVSYIAMELVSGQTLRELLVEGALPTKRALHIGAQVSDGLARAHEAGIVHRDLKPENVMVTRDGFAKILDFGLAKLMETEKGSATHAPTQTSGATGPGVVMGTVGYMSPEQALGRSLDLRSDQFSFGSILYEMATGKRAFARGSAPETLSAIIRDEPEPIGALAPLTPTPLRWIVERCLAKSPDDRYSSTRDLARDLAHLRDHVSEVSTQGIVARRLPPRRRTWLVLALAAVLVLAAALAVPALLRRRPGPNVPAIRFTVPIPPGTIYAPPLETSRGFSISPDGTRMVIEAFSKGRRRLFLRPLESEEAVELEGSTDATAHFWSPDSRFIAFYANGKLKKIPAAGGPPIEICEAQFAFVGAWNRDGTILFARLEPPPGIYRVADTGGEPVRVTTADTKGVQENHLWPVFLPDGRRFLYLTNPRSGLGRRELRLTSLDSKDTRTIGYLNSRVEYSPPGYLIYVRDGALVAQPFDERTARLYGEPRLLASSVHYHYGPAHGAFSVSQTGVLAYQTAVRPSRLAWFDRQGRPTGQLGQPSVIRGVRISPDGARAAVDIGDSRIGTFDVWIFELASGVATRLHSDSVDEIMPVWSPDGSRLIYRSDREGPPDIYEIAVGVPGSERPLLAEPGLEQPEDVSHDGRLLLHLSQVQTSVWNIRVLPLQHDRKSTRWSPTRFHQTSPRFSPDGRWIAYESDESGDSEIYVALTEGAGEKRRISPAGGGRPRWRRDGKELFYVAPGGSVMSVAVTPGPQWTAGAPALLFRIDSEIENYDVTPDGSRFLMATPVERVGASPLHVIVNWAAALEKEK